MITSFNLGGNGGGGSYDDTELRNRITVLEGEIVDVYTKEETYNKEEIDTKVEGLESEISNKVDNETLSHYYTKEETYNKEEVDALIPEVPIATSQLFDDSLIWSGTQEEYDALSEEEKHLYKIYTIEGATNIVTSVNGMTGDVTLEIPEAGGKIYYFDANDLSAITPELAAEIFDHCKNGDTVIGKSTDCFYYVNNYNDWGSIGGGDMQFNSFVYQLFGETKNTRLRSFWLDSYGNIEFEKNISMPTSEVFNEVKAKVDELEMFINPNVIMIGNPTNQSGQISNFSADNYLQFPFLVNFQNRPWEIFMTVTTGDDVVSQHNILDSNYGLALAVHNRKLEIAMSFNGTSWNLSGYTDDNLVIEPNTTYNIKLEYNNSNSMYMLQVWDGNTYMTYWSEYSYMSLYPRTIIIGKSLDNQYIFNGSIDLNNCSLKISGETIWTGVNKTLDPDLDNISDKGVDKIKEIISENAVTSVNGESGDVTINLPTKTSELTNDSGFLTEHQPLKTINNQSIIGTGNIDIQGGGSSKENKVLKIVLDFSPYIIFSQQYCIDKIYIDDEQIYGIYETDRIYNTITNYNVRIDLYVNHINGYSTDSEFYIGSTNNFDSYSLTKVRYSDFLEINVASSIFGNILFRLAFSSSSSHYLTWEETKIINCDNLILYDNQTDYSYRYDNIQTSCVDNYMSNHTLNEIAKVLIFNNLLNKITFSFKYNGIPITCTSNNVFCYYSNLSFMISFYFNEEIKTYNCEFNGSSIILESINSD